MIRALYTAASGMNAQQTNIDNVAHNLANVNTTGFKKSRVEFEDLVLPADPRAGRRDLDHRRVADRPRGRPRHARRRHVARLHDRQLPRRPAARSTWPSRATASSRSTMPDGTTGYTRAGTFHRDAQGLVVTAEGYRARAADHDSRRTPPRSSISTDGIVSATIPGQSAAQQLGTIELATFQNPAGLTPLGGNLFQVTTASGEPQIGAGRHRAARHAGAGLPRRLERQRRRGDGQHDPRPARLRGQLEGDQGRRRDAGAGQQHRPLMRDRRSLLVVLVGRAAVRPRRRRSRSTPPPRAAIVAAVRARMGADAEVAGGVGRARVAAAAATPTDAVLDAGRAPSACRSRVVLRASAGRPRRARRRWAAPRSSRARGGRPRARDAGARPRRHGSATATWRRRVTRCRAARCGRSPASTEVVGARRDARPARRRLPSPPLRWRRRRPCAPGGAVTGLRARSAASRCGPTLVAVDSGDVGDRDSGR